MTEEARGLPDPEPVKEEARRVSPFKIIYRGEDTLDEDENVVFSDYSPSPVPADTPDEIIVPKDESAPVPAPSSDSTQTSEGDLAGTAQTPASKDDGNSNPTKSGSPSSS